jgi:hypothetical protein
LIDDVPETETDHIHLLGISIFDFHAKLNNVRIVSVYPTEKVKENCLRRSGDLIMARSSLNVGYLIPIKCKSNFF